MEKRNKLPKDDIDLRYRDLEPGLQLRIRRTVTLGGLWFGLILLTAGAFVLSKPSMDQAREKRIQQPDYKPPITLRKRAQKALEESNKQ